MSIEKFGPHQWLITAGGVPAYFIYRLLKGTVGIYDEGVKVATVEVKEGDEPKFIGFIATLSKDLVHRASVRTETEIEVDTHYIDHIRGLIEHETSEKMRDDIQKMIEIISAVNQVRSLQKRISCMPRVELTVPENTSPDLKNIMGELERLYKEVLEDKLCRI